MATPPAAETMNRVTAHTCGYLAGAGTPDTGISTSTRSARCRRNRSQERHLHVGSQRTCRNPEGHVSGAVRGMGGAVEKPRTNGSSRSGPCKEPVLHNFLTSRNLRPAPRGAPGRLTGWPSQIYWTIVSSSRRLLSASGFSSCELCSWCAGRVRNQSDKSPSFGEAPAKARNRSSCTVVIWAPRAPKSVNVRSSAEARQDGARLLAAPDGVLKPNTRAPLDNDSSAARVSCAQVVHRSTSAEDPSGRCFSSARAHLGRR